MSVLFYFFFAVARQCTACRWHLLVKDMVMTNRTADGGEKGACLLRKAMRTLPPPPRESCPRQKGIACLLRRLREPGSFVPDPIPSETWIPAVLFCSVSISSVYFGTRFLPERKKNLMYKQEYLNFLKWHTAYICG